MRLSKKLKKTNFKDNINNDKTIFISLKDKNIAYFKNKLLIIELKFYCNNFILKITHNASEFFTLYFFYIYIYLYHGSILERPA